MDGQARELHTFLERAKQHAEIFDNTIAVENSMACLTKKMAIVVVPKAQLKELASELKQQRTDLEQKMTEQNQQLQHERG